VPSFADFIGGKDGSGNLQGYKITPAGSMPVDGSAVTQPVSGNLGRTWSLINTTDSVNVGNFPASSGVTQSTSPWVVSGTVDSAQSGVWSTGRTWNLLNTTDSVNVGNFPATQPISGTVGVTQSTSPWVVGQSSGAELHADIDNFPSTFGVTQSTFPWVTSRNWNLSSGSDSVSAAQSGTWTVQQGGAPWSVSQSGNWSIRAQDGSGNNLTSQANGSQRALDVGIDVSGVQVDPRSIRALTSSDVVTANQGGTWTTGRTWSLLNTTDSVNSVQSGAWTTGRTWNLSSGSDSVSAVQSGTWTVQQGGAPWSQNLTQVGGSSVTLGQKAAASAIPVVTQADSAPASQNITVADSVTASTTVANGQVFYTGTPTAGSAASFATASFESLEVQVTGTWTGTLQTEISMDGGTTWISRGVKQSGTSYIGSSYTQNFEGGANLGGITNFRVRAISVITGTATVQVSLSVNPASILVSNPQMLRDGTTQSTVNTIKAASTAPTTTDTAIVVAESPNAVTNASLGNTLGKVNKFTSGNLSSTTATSGQTVVTYTVTAGKTFYLEEADCSVVLNSAAATQEQFGTCQLLINGAQVWQQYYKGPGSGSFNPVLTYAEPIPVAAGQVVTWQASPAATTNFLWYGNIGGYEK
jgi:hypothetical protein